MSYIKLPHQFTPRHYQVAPLRAFFIDKKRWTIEVLHRRAGKSKRTINKLLMAAMQRVGNYYHTFPELKQARGAIWNNIDKDGMRYIDHIPRHLMKKPPNNSEMRIELINGSMIQLAGSDRYDALMGGNPLGIIFDEYSLQNPYAYHYLSPILTENGGWADFVYTPRGKNHGWDLYDRNKDNPDWFVQKLDITQTFHNDGSRIITDKMIEERRREGMPEELIQQEFYCDFDVALAGAFYSKEMDKAKQEGRIKSFPYFEHLPVHSAWDIGRWDATAIWLFQVKDNMIYIINYYENCLQGMPHYIEWVKAFLEINKLKPGIHLAPHDIKVHEWTNNRTRMDEAARHGFYFEAVPKLNIIDGINCVKSLFKHFIFHEQNCKFGMDLVKQYVRDDHGVPIHNFASHCADGLRTLGVGWFDSYDKPKLNSSRTLSDWMP